MLRQAKMIYNKQQVLKLQATGVEVTSKKTFVLTS